MLALLKVPKTTLLLGACGLALVLGLLCVRGGMVPQSSLVKALKHESIKADLLALNDLARMGLLSEGELELDDAFEDATGDGGALVLGWASRRERRGRRRRQLRLTEAEAGQAAQKKGEGEDEGK